MYISYHTRTPPPYKWSLWTRWQMSLNISIAGVLFNRMILIKSVLWTIKFLISSKILVFNLIKSDELNRINDIEVMEFFYKSEAFTLHVTRIPNLINNSEHLPQPCVSNISTICL